MDEQELIQNPEMLLTLFQQSVERLIEQRPDTAAQEAQLQAVAKAIEQLEKQQVPVPDSLRQTKMSLVAEIGQHTQLNQQLVTLGEGLVEVLEIIESTTGNSHSQGKPHKESMLRQRRRKSNGSKTPHAMLKDYVLTALTDLGGAAQCAEVLDRAEELFQDKLLPGDMDPHKGHGVIWRYNAHWAYQKLIHDGVARRSIKRGYWELAEKQS
jgi:hypothetical protein